MQSYSAFAKSSNLSVETAVVEETLLGTARLLLGLLGLGNLGGLVADFTGVSEGTVLLTLQ